KGGIACVSIGPGNCRVLVNAQGWDGLREDEGWIKIRVMRVVAVPGPPAGVDGKLRQVSKPMSDQIRINSRRSAAHQSGKRTEICRRRSLGDQIRVKELVVSDLIIGVVVNVLSHIRVQHLQRGGVEWITSSTRDLRVLDAT